MSSNRAQYTEQQMQNGATATGNGTALDTNGFHVTMLQVTGITTATITVEATVDGTNWVAWPATNNAGTAATTITADGLYRVDHYATHQLRARISAHTSGAIDVIGRATTL